jgi:hypothetical protein
MLEYLTGNFARTAGPAAADQAFAMVLLTLLGAVGETTGCGFLQAVRFA